MYGDGIAVWLINMFTRHQVNIITIQRIFSESFGINVSPGTLNSMKTQMASRYRRTVNKLQRAIVSGPMLHVDETPVKVKGYSSPYVWVLATMDTVVYFFRPNREADHLKKLLRNFKGVLVSDFYPGYESIACPQQKCLIHLIRDLNDDFLQNQFDQQYKQIVMSFSDLLNETVSTVNERGLKKKYLRKHKKSVTLFYKNVIGVDSNTELAEKWRKRFEKNRDTLFTFLDYDNCPWNNNNAEHAITPFAEYRTRRRTDFTEKTIKEYLILLSVQQTCRYRGISFLEFLRSGRRWFD